MYKNPIFIFFLIATFITFQTCILADYNYIKLYGGISGTIKHLLVVFWFNYIPILILIFLKSLKIIFKNNVLQKLLKILNIVCIIITVIYYLIVEIIYLCAYFAFSNMDGFVSMCSLPIIL